MDVPPLWSFLFFFMLLNLALSSVSAGAQMMVSFITDEFPQLRRHRLKVLFVFFAVSFLVGLPLTCNGGMHLFIFLDSRGTVSTLAIALMQVTNRHSKLSIMAHNTKGFFFFLSVYLHLLVLWHEQLPQRLEGDEVVAANMDAVDLVYPSGRNNPWRANIRLCLLAGGPGTHCLRRLRVSSLGPGIRNLFPAPAHHRRLLLHSVLHSEGPNKDVNLARVLCPRTEAVGPVAEAQGGEVCRSDDQCRPKHRVQDVTT